MRHSQKDNHMLLFVLVIAFLFALTGTACGAEEMTEVQTVSPLVDQLLVWLSVAMTVITLLANTLPPHWSFTQLLARLSTDLRGIRKPDPAKTTKLPSVLLVLLALLLPSCALWRDAVAPSLIECAPDKAYVIDNLSLILAGQDATQVLDRIKSEKGVAFVVCALEQFLDRVAVSPETAQERATARAYIDRERAQ